LWKYLFCGSVFFVYPDVYLGDSSRAFGKMQAEVSILYDTFLANSFFPRTHLPFPQLPQATLFLHINAYMIYMTPRELILPTNSFTLSTTPTAALVHCITTCIIYMTPFLRTHSSRELIHPFHNKQAALEHNRPAVIWSALSLLVGVRLAAVCCSVLQCVAVCCSVLQSVAVCC